MMKKFIVVAAVVAALGMTACSSSSSSTTTTSTTVNGITTTTEVTTITENGQTRTETVKTVTDENGNVLSVTDENGNPIGGETTAAAETEAAETEAPAETEAVAEAQTEVDENDPTGLRARWHDLFFEGAEGENENGDHFFFACDDSNNVQEATVIILNKDMTELNYYYLGNVGMEDDAMVIYDVDGENSLPFVVGDGEEADTFTMTFKDGDVATMHYVDQDVIINDMVSVVEALNI
ncbi:MAG: hypothetical protein IKI35_09040 [Stomatobaculum sp.]|nr:hypothetical protein [Stomatobaculum sp.]